MIELARDALRRAGDEASKRALTAVRPIYRNIGTKPNHLGTVTFVQVDDIDYVLTAAHVIDHHTSHTRFIGHKGLQPVTLTFRTTVAPRGDRDKDRWDFSFAKVDQEWRSKGIEPIDISNLPTIHDVRFFTAVGYPIRRTENTIRRRGIYGRRSAAMHRLGWAKAIRFMAI